jgi:hypothetical protein
MVALFILPVVLLVLLMDALILALLLRYEVLTRLRPSKLAAHANPAFAMPSGNSRLYTCW